MGGAGADKLYGGSGNDTFKYTAFSEAAGDQIFDFAAGDQIDFSTISGRKFIGNTQFNGVAGEIRYYYKPDFYSFSFDSGTSINPLNSTTTIGTSAAIIEIDANGDAEADYQLIVNGDWRLQQSAANSGILVAAAKQTLTGDANANTLTGGAGDDTLNGLGGIDTLYGGEGNDKLNGGDGNDILFGGLGTDTYTGGAGSDSFRFYNEDEINGDTLTDFTAASDHILVNIQGLSFIGDNPFSSAPGEYRYENKQLDFDFDGNGQTDRSIFLKGFSGELQAAYGVYLVAAANTLTGGNGDDLLLGLAGADTLNGGQGRDALFGGDGNDTLNGGSGNDVLNGGTGDDTLVGGFGYDSLTGGAGNDVFKFNALDEIGKGSSPYSTYSSQKIDTINDLAVGDKIDLSAIADLSFVGVGNDFTGDAGQIRIGNRRSGFDSITTTLEIDSDGFQFTNSESNASYYSSPYADYVIKLGPNLNIEETAPGSRIFQVAANLNLNGDANANTLTGANGNDTLNGLGGNDTLSGGYGADTLNGGDGFDSLDGGIGNDTLIGGTGNDTLVGGLGFDALTGGAGNDVFKFNSLQEIGTYIGVYGGYEGDSITDFTTGDKIDLSGIDANQNVAGDQAFAFIGTADFTGVAGDLHFVSGYLSGDINGDSTADFNIHLLGSPTLTAADFIL